MLFIEFSLQMQSKKTAPEPSFSAFSVKEKNSPKRNRQKLALKKPIFDGFLSFENH
ncbi:hypothetical protein [Enterococcus asini]|uniref:hypothetical protein n=1 Tax=Enterococcus asini TaxID=57732 RepID=UPI001E6592C8|nr:hypothetical protein [Enterococcus asini]